MEEKDSRMYYSGLRRGEEECRWRRRIKECIIQD